MEYHLAQVNIGRLMAPLDSEQLAGFVNALQPVNAVADNAPGFVWRLEDDAGNATAIEAFSWDAGDSAGIIVNLSVWVDLEHLTAFVYGDAHRAVLSQRRQYFQPMQEAYAACWWLPAGVLPTTDEAEDRVRHLRTNGPTAYAFTVRQPYPPPQP